MPTISSGCAARPMSAACAIDREVVFATIKEERFTLPQLKNKLKDKHEKQLEHALERLDLAFVIGREKNEYTYRVPMFVEMVREST